MSWRTVIVSGQAKLDYKMGFMVVRGEETRRVVLDEIATLVIENPGLFRALITDIQAQLYGMEGRAVLSLNGKSLPLSKNLELLDRFIPFDLNTKTLITKINADLEKKAVSDEYYPETLNVLGQLEKLLTDLSFDYPCGIEFPKLSAGAVLKAAGVEICDDYDSLGEKILDYFQLVNDLVGRKLFITVNLRSYFSDMETQLFMKTVASHGFDVIMIESFEHARLDEEKRLIIDADLCLIG